MADSIGNKEKCTFCPNTQEVVRTTLGGIDTYMCSKCIAKTNEEAAIQGIDAIGFAKICERQAGASVLVLRYLDFKAELDVHGKGTEFSILVDRFVQFFQGAGQAIRNGKLGEVRLMQAAVKKSRQVAAAIDGELEVLHGKLGNSQEAIIKVKDEMAGLQRTVDDLQREIEEAKAEEEKARAMRKQAEVKASDLTARLAKLLGEANLV